MTTDISVGLPLPAPDRDAALRTALVQLAEAYAYAKERQGKPWLFAVERERLLALGVSTNLLRWLWQKGYVDPANEVTSPRDRTRKFRPCHNLVRPKRTCFILTDAGALFAARVLKQPAGCLPNGVAADEDVGLPAAPCWDGWRRVLRVGVLLVKDYRLPSPTQEAILEAFQEEGWPRRIDDPLPLRTTRTPSAACMTRSSGSMAASSTSCCTSPAMAPGRPFAGVMSTASPPPCRRPRKTASVAPPDPSG